MLDPLLLLFGESICSLFCSLHLSDEIYTVLDVPILRLRPNSDRIVELMSQVPVGDPVTLVSARCFRASQCVVTATYKVIAHALGHG